MITEKKGSSRYGLIALLILALFITAIFFYTRNNRIGILSSNIKQLQTLDSEYAQLDTCVLRLYKADNSSRLYEATGNKKYIKQFLAEINGVTAILDSLKNRDSVKVLSQNVKGLVELKRARTNVYLNLKRLTDSLWYVNTGIDTASKNAQIAGQ